MSTDRDALAEAQPTHHRHDDDAYSVVFGAAHTCIAPTSAESVFVLTSEERARLIADAKAEGITQGRGELRAAEIAAFERGLQAAADAVCGDCTAAKAEGYRQGVNDTFDTDGALMRARAEDAALARIRHLEAGAADDRGPENASPTPGQLLRRWIDADPDERLAFAERAIHNAEQAHKCFLFNHRGRIAHMERLLRERDLDPTAPAHRHDRETTAEEAD